MNMWKLYHNDYDLWCFVKLYFDKWYNHEMTFHCFERTVITEAWINVVKYIDGKEVIVDRIMHREIPPTRGVKVWFDDKCEEFVFYRGEFSKADYYDFIDYMLKLCPEKTQEV